MTSRRPSPPLSMLSTAVVLLAAAAAVPLPASAAGTGTEPAATAATAAAEAGKTPPVPPAEKLSTTHHTITVGGRRIAYTATAGNLLLKEEDGKPRASVFFIAYTEDGRQPGERPVTFAFNGGPGSSSVWLHLGAFGPKRVAMDDEGKALPPPYRLVDNEESLLDLTDLVFIDPVSTGYSRAVPGEDPKQFHGIEEDIESVGAFIRLWTTRFERWSSPKLLAGESYGTTRAAGLSRYLQEHDGLYLNGIVLVSSILNFQTARFDVGNDLPYVLFLPTYAATAWFHGKLPEAQQAEELPDLLAEVRRFALGEYAPALLQGNRLSDEERERLAGRLAAYTGLGTDYLLEANLRPVIYRFTKQLERRGGKTVGRLDSRFEGLDRDSTGESFEYDPSYAAIQGPFTAMLNDYLRRDLGYESDLPYEILTDRVDPWSFARFENRYVDVAEDLRRAMAENPSLRVFVAAGYYDLATPFFATEYTLDHLGFDPTYGDRLTLAYYEAGHMMYIRRASRQKLKRDLAAFYGAAVGNGK